MKSLSKNITTRTVLIAVALTLSACAPVSPIKLQDDTIQESGYVGADHETNELESNVGIVKGSAAAPSPINQSKSKFAHLDPKGIVPKVLLAKVLAYYVQHSSSIKNKAYVSVIDFARPSNRKRLFIINMSTGRVWALPVAHGRGSDLNHDGVADRFSNRPDSHATSLGFYKTAETYIGNHGYSLRLDGLSSTNSNARPRAVVIHGATYVQERDVIQGRSYGCPAVPMSVRRKVIDALKGGSILYAGRSY